MGKEYPPDESGQPESINSAGFVKMMRSQDHEQGVCGLIRKSPLAFALAAYIAHCARFQPGMSIEGFNQGEAAIGNYALLGMTRQQYRTALKVLVKSRFATIKTSPRGTIAKLIDTRLFDVLNESSKQGAQPTANHQATNSQPLTKNGKKEKNGKNVRDEETGGEGRPCFSDAPKAGLDNSKPSKPLSVSAVVLFALPRLNYQTSWVAEFVDGANFNLSAHDLLANLDDDLREAMTWAFRFIHYNNRQGWPLQCSWQAAFDGFLQNCDHGCGPANVPHDWIPHIAGDDEVPNS